ncbi:MAG: hypothetical protein QNI87_14775 [Erythrobacter sp.]|uniref:hypothetical protein n=1 Tax=Erythrobacter sp. TaxID=1042 RepID=UPI002621537E|nr:hypothetical protein [Erythrobacter sp.]MDJ0979786.1 hypothetical protein [Erythrobacter sp.]
MKFPNRIQAALLLDARFEGLDAVTRDFARIVEMKSGATFNVSEHRPGAFARLVGGGEDLILTFEYVESPASPQLFANALASPVTTLRVPDMKARIEFARSHIALEVAHGAFAAVGEEARMASTFATLDPAQSEAGAAAFVSRLETLALMARVATDCVTPSAIHWAQSDQLFDPETFEEQAREGFPGPLAIHPVLYANGADEPDPGSFESGAEIGLRTFGARHWLGHEVTVRPTALPWAAAYQSVLAFCAFAASRDVGSIGDGDTFSPAPSRAQDSGEESGEESGEIWTVRRHQADPNDAATGPGDALGGPVPVYELVPLRHDACAFIADDYAREANVLCQRTPKAKAKTDSASIDEDTEVSCLAELEAALAEGRAEAAANPPAPLPEHQSEHPPEHQSEHHPDHHQALQTASDTGRKARHEAAPTLCEEPAPSGRSLRARVFGDKDV